MNFNGNMMIDCHLQGTRMSSHLPTACMISLYAVSCFQNTTARSKIDYVKTHDKNIKLSTTCFNRHSKHESKIWIIQNIWIQSEEPILKLNGFLFWILISRGTKIQYLNFWKNVVAFWPINIGLVFPDQRIKSSPIYARNSILLYHARKPSRAHEEDCDTCETMPRFSRHLNKLATSTIIVQGVKIDWERPLGAVLCKGQRILTVGLHGIAEQEINLYFLINFQINGSHRDVQRIRYSLSVDR